MGLVVPAVLPISRKDLEEKIDLFTKTSASRVQIDVVDGKFISPASWPYSAPGELDAMVAHAEMLPKLEDFEYEVDLMCLDAERAAEAWLAVGATRLTFHAESTTDVLRLISYVQKKYGSGEGFASNLVSFGLAIGVESDLALIEQVIRQISYVQFMGIARIGVQGQPFDRRVLEKVRIFRERHPECPIQVDGGVSVGTAQELLALGVRDIIVGSALVQARDIGSTYAAFESLQSPYGV